MIDDLAGGLAAVAEARAVTDVIEPGFQQLEEDRASDATTAGGFFVVTANIVKQLAGSVSVRRGSGNAG